MKGRRQRAAQAALKEQREHEGNWPSPGCASVRESQGYSWPSIPFRSCATGIQAGIQGVFAGWLPPGHAPGSESAQGPPSWLSTGHASGASGTSFGIASAASSSSTQFQQVWTEQSLKPFTFHKAKLKPFTPNKPVKKEEEEDEGYQTYSSSSTSFGTAEDLATDNEPEEQVLIPADAVIPEEEEEEPLQASVAAVHVKPRKR